MQQEGGAEHGDIVEAAARGLLGKLEGLAQVAHWEDWAGAPCGPDCRHPELAQMQPQDAAVAALLSALQALAGSRPAAALAAAQELLGGCLAAFLRPAHVAPLLAACGRMGWWPLRSHLVLLLEKCAWSADYRLPFQLLVDLASAQQGDMHTKQESLLHASFLHTCCDMGGSSCGNRGSRAAPRLHHAARWLAERGAQAGQGLLAEGNPQGPRRSRPLSEHPRLSWWVAGAPHARILATPY